VSYNVNFNGQLTCKLKVRLTTDLLHWSGILLNLLLLLYASYKKSKHLRNIYICVTHSCKNKNVTAMSLLVVQSCCSC
jgi:hypothetical protein